MTRDDYATARVAALATREGASIGAGRNHRDPDPGKAADLIVVAVNQPHLTL